MTAIRYFTQEGGRFTVATGRPTAPSPLCPSGPHQRPGGAVQRGGHLRLSGRPAGGAELAGRVRLPRFGGGAGSLPLPVHRGLSRRGHLHLESQRDHSGPQEEGQLWTIPCVQWSRFPPLGKGPVSPRPRDLLAARAFLQRLTRAVRSHFSNDWYLEITRAGCNKGVW